MSQNSELPRRGWTYQEALLSSRCIFFARFEACFASRGGTRRESIVASAPLQGAIGPLLLGASFPYTPPSDILLGDFVLSFDPYKQRHLSYEQDVLSAYKGILSRSVVTTYWRVPVVSYVGLLRVHVSGTVSARDAAQEKLASFPPLELGLVSLQRNLCAGDHQSSPICIEVWRPSSLSSPASSTSLIQPSQFGWSRTQAETSRPIASSVHTATPGRGAALVDFQHRYQSATTQSGDAIPRTFFTTVAVKLFGTPYEGTTPAWWLLLTESEGHYVRVGIMRTGSGGYDYPNLQFDPSLERDAYWEGRMDGCECTARADKRTFRVG